MHPRDIQKELDLLKGSVSRIITSLQDIGLVERAGGAIHLARTPPAEAFKRLYYSHRASPLQEILSGRRVELLSRLVQNPKSLKALARETGISSDTVYYYLQGFLQLGLTSRFRECKACRQRLFCILLYLKNKDKLQGTLHPMVKTIRTVLRGEHIKGYSTLDEIEEPAELYGIQDIEA